MFMDNTRAENQTLNGESSKNEPSSVATSVE